MYERDRKISSFLKASSILWALIICHVCIILIAIETLILRETEDSYVREQVESDRTGSHAFLQCYLSLVPMPIRYFRK